MNETYDVAVLHEVFSSPETMEIARTNLETRIRAAGLDAGKAITAVLHHPHIGVFVMVATVIREG